MNESKSIGTMFSNLPHLRRYAIQAIVEGHELNESEMRDKDSRLNQFTVTGTSLNWTDKEMVVLILREVFATTCK